VKPFCWSKLEEGPVVEQSAGVEVGIADDANADAGAVILRLSRWQIRVLRRGQIVDSCCVARREEECAAVRDRQFWNKTPLPCIQTPLGPRVSCGRGLTSFRPATPAMTGASAAGTLGSAAQEARTRWIKVDGMRMRAGLKDSIESAFILPTLPHVVP